MLVKGTMLTVCLLVLAVWSVEGAVQNISCPEVTPTKLDLKELDGKWYFASAATDLQLSGDCAMINFKHTSANTTNVSISWVTNKTASYYNGSATVIVDTGSGNGTGKLLTITYSDNKLMSYSILGVDYEHYAVVFSCNNTDGQNGTSTYELWQLSRMPHVKATDAVKFDEAVKNYNLQNTELRNFNNTEECCKTTSGGYISPSSFILTSLMSATVLKRIF